MNGNDKDMIIWVMYGFREGSHWLEASTVQQIITTFELHC